MSDDTHDHTTDLAEPYDYEDLVSQRAKAFCHVAKLADTIKDETVRASRAVITTGCLTTPAENQFIYPPSVLDRPSCRTAHIQCVYNAAASVSACRKAR